jgi:hypothetical protein
VFISDPVSKPFEHNTGIVAPIEGIFTQECKPKFLSLFPFLHSVKPRTKGRTRFELGTTVNMSLIASPNIYHWHMYM